MISLKPVTKINFDDAIKISVTPKQKLIISDVVYSLAECYVYPKILKPFLVLNKDIPVGFILFNIEEKESKYGFARIMIDQHHQGLGYGKKAVILGIQYLKAMGAKVIELSHLKENPNPVKLYKSLGFKYTGKLDYDGGYMMELIVNN